jgi:hypothetical protein
LFLGLLISVCFLDLGLWFRVRVLFRICIWGKVGLGVGVSLRFDFFFCCQSRYSQSIASLLELCYFLHVLLTVLFVQKLCWKGKIPGFLVYKFVGINK